MIIPQAIRQHIRRGLTCNWAGRYTYAYRNGAVIERTTYPVFITNLPGVNRTTAPTDQFRVIFGESQSRHKSDDWILGRRISFFGKIRGTICPARMLGEESFNKT